jgi:release factor glutamine methyltransferase
MPQPSRTSRSDQVYPVQEDTLLLLGAVIGELKKRDWVLEVGTGSGYIASTVKTIAPKVITTDINPHAIQMARERGVDVVRTDLMDGLCGPFDLVICNPPYLPTAEAERINDWLERALDGGPTGRRVIERFAKEVKRVLSEKGRILLLVSSLTGIETVQELFSYQGFQGKIICKIQIEGEDLVVLRIRYAGS